MSNSSNSNIWKKIGIGAAITGGIIAGVALLPITLGFGTAGIGGGSIAAGIQAAIGNVAAGSIFAVCTSLGMSGVFATTAAVGAILGAGGLAAYLKNDFSAEKDAKLIDATIDKKDNPDIIIKLLECRFPSEIEEIREKYNALGENYNFDEDIINYVGENSKNHVKNLLKRTREIVAKTEEVKKQLNYRSFIEYLEGEFNPENDAKLIKCIIDNKDDPLMLIRLLSYRKKEQRTKLEDQFNNIYFSYIDNNSKKRKKGMKALAIAYTPDFEHTYVNDLLVTT